MHGSLEDNFSNLEGVSPPAPLSKFGLIRGQSLTIMSTCGSRTSDFETGGVLSIHHMMVWIGEIVFSSTSFCTHHSYYFQDRAGALDQEFFS